MQMQWKSEMEHIDANAMRKTKDNQMILLQYGSSGIDTSIADDWCISLVANWVFRLLRELFEIR